MFAVRERKKKKKIKHGCFNHIFCMNMKKITRIKINVFQPVAKKFGLSNLALSPGRLGNEASIKAYPPILINQTVMDYYLLFSYKKCHE